MKQTPIQRITRPFAADRRVIVWELHRPSVNKDIAEQKLRDDAMLASDGYVSCIGFDQNLSDQDPEERAIARSLWEDGNLKSTSDFVNDMHWYLSPEQLADPYRRLMWLENPASMHEDMYVNENSRLFTDAVAFRRDSDVTHVEMIGRYMVDCDTETLGPNSAIVVYNDVTTHVTSSNTCVAPLLAPSQARGTTFYMNDYLVKDSGKVHTILPMIKSMIHIVNMSKTLAEDDKDEAERFTMRLLNRYYF